MMQRERTPGHWAAAGLGMICLGVSTWTNVQEIHSRTKDWADSTILMVVAVSVAAAFALVYAFKAWHEGLWPKAVILFLGFIFGAGCEITTTLDRVATQRDAKMHSIWSSDKKWQHYSKVEQDENYLASRECTKVVGTRGHTDGPVCQAHRNEEAIARDLRMKRETELDSLGQRLSAMTLGAVSPKLASLYQPVLWPFALWLLFNGLLAFGLDGREIEPEFNFEQKGRKADLAKAGRFIDGYKSSHGQLPSIHEVVEACDVKEYTAAKLLREAA